MNLRESTSLQVHNRYINSGILLSPGGDTAKQHREVNALKRRQKKNFTILSKPVPTLWVCVRIFAWGKDLPRFLTRVISASKASSLMECITPPARFGRSTHSLIQALRDLPHKPSTKCVCRKNFCCGQEVSIGNLQAPSKSRSLWLYAEPFSLYSLLSP